VNAIFGALVSLTGSALLVQTLLSAEYQRLWIPAVLMCIGLIMLLRNRREDEMDAARYGARCSTCRGAGTVYSEEWNDWRRSGPIHTIRELCPVCQGSN
jgi:uncharacterized membrane protein YfcA